MFIRLDLTTRSRTILARTPRRFCWTVPVVLLLCACGMPLTPSPAASSGQFATKTSANPTQHTATTADIRMFLPTVPPFPVKSAACSPNGGSTLAVEPVVYPGLAGQAWAAEQIVVGKVIAQEVRWEQHPAWGPTIYTYSLVHVNERIRGTQENPLLVYSYGGTLDGCTQRSSLPILQNGETALLFLLREGTQTPPLYHIDGGQPELRQIVTAADGTPSVISPETTLPLESLLAQLRQALVQPPPKELDPRFVVPLDRAPLVRSATPAR